MEQIKKLIVHGGVFHADDVLCAAITKQLNPDVEIERVFHAPESVEPGTIVADIGGGKYDHHQENPALREDKHLFAACGLLLRDVNSELFPNGQPEQFAEEIKLIEDADNGVGSKQRHILSDLVHFMNPTWEETTPPNAAFEKAVELVQEHYLEPYIEQSRLPEKDMDILAEKLEERNKEYEVSKEHAKEIAEEAIAKSDGKTVILPRFIPWQDYVCPTSAEFVIFPSNRGGYNLQCVPPTPESFDKKRPLPEEWLENKPAGCTFVHQGRFISGFETEEAAKDAVKGIYKTKNRSFEELINRVHATPSTKPSKEDNKEIEDKNPGGKKGKTEFNPGD